MPEHQQIQQSKKNNIIFQKQATPVIQTPLSNPYSIIQRARINPQSLTHADIMQLQRTIGNQAVGRLLSSIGSSSTAQQATVQRQEIPEQEEPLQGKFENKPEQMACPSCFTDPIVQRQEIPEEEEPLQGKMMRTIQRQEISGEEEPLQGKFESIQRQEIPEEEEPLQGKMADPLQLQEIPEEEEPLQTKRENNTGMPDNLKAGVENLSGIDMSDVKVHYNSDKPAEVGALAYTQGTEIHVAPGQERHLPHEAWHVVQQKQGRVQPTMQLKEGIPVNDDAVLEQEADEMGTKAGRLNQKLEVSEPNLLDVSVRTSQVHSPVQRIGPTPGSHPMLANEYNHLCNSAAFQEMNIKVTTDQDINLVNSSAPGLANPPTDYDPATHTIRVPVMAPPAAIVVRPAPDIRDDILWEMHNASIRGHLTRTGNVLLANISVPGAPPAKLIEFQRAAYALSIEWEEWMNVIEHNLKVQMINNDPAMPGGPGPHVTPGFAAGFVVPGAGWFQFINYLNTQIAQGHTVAYDGGAANPNWVGHKILKIAKSKSMSYLQVSQQQVNDYLRGKTKTVKKASNNPFKSISVIKESMGLRL